MGPWLVRSPLDGVVRVQFVSFPWTLCSILGQTRNSHSACLHPGVLMALAEITLRWTSSRITFFTLAFRVFLGLVLGNGILLSKPKAKRKIQEIRHMFVMGKRLIPVGIGGFALSTSLFSKSLSSNLSGPYLLYHIRCNV